MKTLVIATMLVLLASSVVGAIPYPYRSYTLSTTGVEAQYDRLQDLYTVSSQAEDGSSYPWTEGSSAHLLAPEILAAMVYRDAERQFLSTAERDERIKGYMASFVDNLITFGITLETSPSVERGYRYAEIGTGLSYIDTVVLETSDGKRYTPVRQDGDSFISGGRWVGINHVMFPRYDGNTQIINQRTNWVRVWVVSGSRRIYYHFDIR